jgi:hypothetical protein
MTASQSTSALRPSRPSAIGRFATPKPGVGPQSSGKSQEPHWSKRLRPVDLVVSSTDAMHQFLASKQLSRVDSMGADKPIAPPKLVEEAAPESSSDSEADIGPFTPSDLEDVPGHQYWDELLRELPTEVSILQEDSMKEGSQSPKRSVIASAHGDSLMEVHGVAARSSLELPESTRESRVGASPRKFYKYEGEIWNGPPPPSDNSTLIRDVRATLYTVDHYDTWNALLPTPYRPGPAFSAPLSVSHHSSLRSTSC